MTRIYYAGPNLESAYIDTLMTALLVALPGRVWEGKVGVWSRWKEGDDCFPVVRKLLLVHREWSVFAVRTLSEVVKIFRS